MTNKEIADHWQKTLKDIRENESLLGDKMWRMENLYMIITKNKERKIFKFNRAQKHYISNRKHKNILVKSRQLGFTTLITLWNLDNILFQSNTEALSIAHTKGGMSDIFDKKVRFAISNMAPQIRSAWDISQNSTTKIQIKRNEAMSIFSVSLSGRSGTNHFVHVSEYAKLCVMFPNRAQEVITGTFPSVPFDGFIDIESTAEGAQGDFYDMYMEAQDSLKFFNDSLSRVQFFPHFYNFTWDDEELKKIKEPIPIEHMEVKDIDWESVKIEHNLTDIELTYYYMKWVSLKKDSDKLHQEYPVTWEEAFLASGTPYFSAKRVADMKLRARDTKRYDVIGATVEEVYGGPMMVYELPIKGMLYVIGGDTAEGLAHGDASTLTVVRADTKQIVAVYKSNIEPFEFTSAAFTIGRWYNNALLAIEVNKDGLWVNDQLQRMGYENLYFKENIDDITKNITKFFGWRTDRKTRDVMLTELKVHFTHHEMLILWLLDEMQTFVRNKRGKPEAVSGKHDDVIMATAIAYEVLKQRFAGLSPVEVKVGGYMETIFGK